MHIGRLLLKPFLGKRQLQPVFELMYRTGLAGLNVGEGGMPDQSGEEWLMSFLVSEITRRNAQPVIFDIGANVGQFATTVLSAFPGTPRLWSFEPGRSTFSSLKENLGDRPNVRLINAAVGSARGTVEMFSPVPGSKLASLYDRTTIWQDSKAVEKVDCRALDEFCRENEIKHIDLLKIDVEGHELEVLRGAKGLLESNAVDFIQFEFSAAHIDARVFFRDFYSLLQERYEISRILQNGLYPIRKYNPELELFKRATNYLAIRKNK